MPVNLNSVTSDVINSEEAIQGQVLTADGDGGAAFETVPLITRVIPLEMEPHGNYGNYASKIVASNGEGYFSFIVPDDFTSLVELVLNGIPEATVTDQNIQFSSSYGTVGELYNQHSESAPAGLFSTVINQILEIDISSVFSSINAGDRCGLYLKHNSIGTTINYITGYIKYTTT